MLDSGIFKSRRVGNNLLKICSLTGKFLVYSSSKLLLRACHIHSPAIFSSQGGTWPAREGKREGAVEEKGPPPALGPLRVTPPGEHQPQLRRLCFPPADPQEKVPTCGRQHLHCSRAWTPLAHLMPGEGGQGTKAASASGAGVLPHLPSAPGGTELTLSQAISPLSTPTLRRGRGPGLWQETHVRLVIPHPRGQFLPWGPRPLGSPGAVLWLGSAGLL